MHDSVLGLQATLLTAILNPSTLTRVYDNEMRVPADQDAVTLPELLNGIRDQVWSELAAWKDGGQFTSRKPYITSLRRNLQREHLDRLIDVVVKPSRSSSSPAYAPLIDLATQQLTDLQGKVNALVAKPMDPYSLAHLQSAARRIKSALEAEVEMW